MTTSFQVQVASIMEVLAKTAVAEMTKLVGDESAGLRLEMSRNQRENEALKTKLLLVEGELRDVRGYGEETPCISLNLSFEVQVCDEFRETQRPKVAGKGNVSIAQRASESFHLKERLSTHPTRDEQNVPVDKREATPDAFVIKYEPVDGEQDWSESLLLSEDRLEEDPKSSQSQVEQKMIDKNTCGTSGAAAANGGEGPLCKVEELHMQPCPAGDPEKGLKAEIKQEPEEQPLTPTLPQLESVDLGLQIQSVWSEANSSEKKRRCGGSLQHGDARLDDDFFPPHYRASQRPHLENDRGSASHLDLKQHLNTFPLGSPGECDGSLCEASSDTSAEAKSPCRTQGQEEELICTHCGKTFPDALELKTHEEQHSAGKRFSCSECNKSFSQSRNLKAHESTHTGQTPYDCTECGKQFPYKSSLKVHQLSHTGEKCFSCTVCNKNFSCQGSLNAHQKVHTGEKPFTCEQCGKCFAWKSHVKIHQIIHTGEKRFSCTVCNKSFYKRAHLQNHQRIHTGEKLFTCEQCGKCFSRKCYLKTHQSVHTKEKPFVCELCGRCFSHKCNLKLHQRVHTGEKPHRCNECGRSFAHPSTLKSHQMIHTRGEIRYSCTLCSRIFSNKGNLKTHILSHSKD